MEHPNATIENDVLRVRLFLPDEEKGYYRGTRFDWSGVVFDLRFVGRRFYGPWFDEPDPLRHDSICGPVDEFGEIVSSDGERVLKIGVGVLEKAADEPYDRFKTYAIADPGSRNVDKTDTEIRFDHVLRDRTFSYRYEKTIRIHGDMPVMSIGYRLTNEGTSGWKTNVYNHHFAVIDDGRIGPDTVVRFPFSPEGAWRDAGGPGRIEGRTIGFERELGERERVYIGDLRGFENRPEHHAFTLESRSAGAGIEVAGSHPVDHIVFWACRRTCCVEPYIDLDIRPGETFCWHNRFAFYTAAR